MKKNNQSPVLANTEHIYVQANNFITAKYKDSMSFWEFLLIAKMCTMISPADTDFKGYQIYIKDLLKFLDLPDSGNVYKYVLEAAERLLERRVVITYSNDEGQEVELDTHLVAGVEKLKRPHKNDSLFVTLTFLPQLRPFLLQLQTDFTKFDFRHYKLLRTGSSIRLYHVLKQYFGRKQRHVEVDLEELKAMLGVADKYDLYGHFKTRVLDEAKKRLADTTDIRFDYEEIKAGKKVCKIKFHIFENHPIKLIETVKKNSPITHSEQPAINSPSKSKTELSEIERIVCQEFGVSKTVFKHLESLFDEQDLQKAIQITRRAIENGKAESKAGFFVKAVKERYSDPKIEQEEKNKRSKALADQYRQQEEVRAEQIRKAKNDKFLAEEKLILSLIQEEIGLQKAAIDKVRYSLFGGSYNPALTFAENYKNESFRVAFCNAVKTLRPEKF
ncbi:MAG: replication initiation protein [Saprospiraceae bacterium]|nr:replication initiation protein [Saprospiraceae bacterium]